ncbi:MAG: hypothetical protein JO069_12775 [Verrucomicrobia bacterium]|nr:hypothetical protein [Verrucomicrobiota bacterium]
MSGLHPFCPVCHTRGEVHCQQQLSHDEDDDPGYRSVVKCHHCGYQTNQFSLEQLAIESHNRNVGRFKQALKTAYQEGQDSMTYDEQNADDWLKGKGL